MSLGRNRFRSGITIGALLGAAAALLVGGYAQGMLWLHTDAQSVSTGAPQGTDQLTYFSMCRAVMRSSNGITYAYPYQLYWPVPEVAFQLPITLLAWLGRAVGLPAAFEVARVLGAAGAGAALGALGYMFPRGFWRKWFYLLIVFGGALFGAGALYHALRIGGLDAAITEPHQYIDEAMDKLIWWLPFPVQNLRMPLECLYHALVFGGLACLAWNRLAWAWTLGLLIWMSNPFAAVALHGAALPWLLWRAMESQGTSRRRYGLHLVAWLAVNGAAVAYYGWFLNRWPVMRELHRLYEIQYVPALPMARLLLLTMPWLAALVASLVVPSLWKRVWGRPQWRLFALLAVVHLVLLQQSAFLGERSMQAYHYNRGYLQLGLVITATRVLWLVTNRRPGQWVIPKRLRPWKLPPGAGRRLAWGMTILLMVTGLDNLLFALYTIDRPSVVGMQSRAYSTMVHAIPTHPAPMLVLLEPEGGLPASYVTAATPHVAYMASETMVVPYPAEREAYLRDAWKGEHGGLAGLGLDYLIIHQESAKLQNLKNQGWELVKEEAFLALYRAPHPQPGINPPLP